MIKTSEFPLEISASLKSGTVMHNWLSEVMIFSALMGGVLRIMHPDLYAAGIQALVELAGSPELVKEGNDVLPILAVWSLPFSSYSIISNRKTPVHRDNSSRPAWYDMLVTLGAYEDGDLRLPGIGLTFDYRPGSVVALGGKLLKHEVPEVEGNRVCLAYYMRDKVHERLQIPAPGWMSLDKYGG